jgi:hypothetical protein
MDLSSTSSNWIYAYKAGSALNSDSPSASIEQHDQYGTFNLNLATATGGNGNVNPFTTTATSASNNGNGSMNNTMMNSSMLAGGDSTTESPEQIIMDGTVAHGVMGAATFLLLFPSGSIVMRVFNFKGLIWLHVGIQVVSYLVALALMETGVWIAVNNGQVCTTALIYMFMLIETDDGYASHPWSRCSLWAVLPAIPGHWPPRPIQEQRRTQCTNIPAHLVGPHPYYPRHHQRLPWHSALKTRQLHDRWDSVCCHR